MGYSARYHAASLAAVLIALAAGILIGVEFGDTVVSETAEGLEESLKGDLNAAREEVDRLEAELGREREFGERAYPALVGDLLRRQRVEVIALGDVPEGTEDDVSATLGPTGAELARITVVRVPPDVEALADRLSRTRYRRVARSPDLLEELGHAAGRDLVRGGRVTRRARNELLARTSGSAGRSDAVVVVRQPTESENAREATAIERFESGLLEGIRDAGRPVVGVERSDAPESSVALFDAHGLATVDSVDLISGRVAMVFALHGANGNFGIKESADELLPDLLVPSRGGGQSGGGG